MALYLQMDGVDDKLVAANMLYDEIVMDINTEYVSGTPYYFSSRLVTNGSYSSSTAADADFVSAGVTRTLNGTTTTAAFPRNQRIVAGFKMTTAVTHGVYIFARDNNTSYRKGNVYNVKIYYQGVLKAHYDMTTGTVQDQSGNGNHATLTGGTWLDDGVGGGIDGSTKFDLKQVLYSDSFISTDTKQVLYSDSATAFDTLQSFFSDGIIGSTPFDIRIVFYNDNSVVNDLKQMFYTDGSFSADAKQTIYQDGNIKSDVKTVIYADSSQINDLMQSFYQDGFIDFDTLQEITDGDPILAVIRLKGKQILEVNLVGKQSLNINLDGKQQNGIRLKGLVQ